MTISDRGQIEFVEPDDRALRGAFFTDTSLRRRLFEIVLGVVVMAAAWAATIVVYHFIPSLKEHGLFAMFMLATVIAAWRGGTLSALVSVCLSSLLMAWQLPPNNSFRIARPEDVTRFGLFIFIALLITYLRAARMHAEHRLFESEQRLRVATEAASIGCWDINFLQGAFWRSDTLPSLFGRQTADFATTYEGFFAYLYPEDREFFSIAQVGSGATEKNYEITHRITCADGTLRKVKTRGRMYFDGQNRLERMVGAVFPIEPDLTTVRQCKSGFASLNPRILA